MLDGTPDRFGTALGRLLFVLLRRLAQSEDMIGDHAKREALLQKAPFAPSFAFLLCPLPVATVRGPQAEHRPAPTGGGYKGGRARQWSAGGRRVVGISPAPPLERGSVKASQVARYRLF
jgi:hypothetical protein